MLWILFRAVPVSVAHCVLTVCVLAVNSVLIKSLCVFLQVHDYLRSKLCSLYENDCIFDKFECAWNGSDR